MLVIEVAEIVLHEADEPDLVADLYDADHLAGKYDAQVDFLPVVTNTAASGDDDGPTSVDSAHRERVGPTSYSPRSKRR